MIINNKKNKDNHQNTVHCSLFTVQKGFTLLELITIVAIITTLSLIVLTNYRQGERQFALQRSAHKLGQDIRAAQEMAMSGQECQICSPPVVPAGYGIWIETGNPTYCENHEPICYRLYADTDPDPDGNQFYTPADTIIETITLESGVIIQGISTLPDKVGINFSPPDPIISIRFPPGGESEEINIVVITLALKTDDTKTKTIIVNKAGLIDID